MANEEQVAMLKRSVDAWNTWRVDQPAITPDLSRANLREADLREANLREAILSRADLRGAILSGARLYRANLDGADLRGVGLYRAGLREAILSRADLSRADLSRADLGGADLGGAILSGARLYRADLREAALDGADLREANLREADLREADLREANLRGTTLTGASLSKEQLASAIGADVSSITSSPTLFLQSMILVPWAKASDAQTRNIRILIWAIGWIWAVVGLFTGSIFASYFVTLLPIQVAQYHDVLVTVGAVVGGFLIQMVGLFILSIQSGIIKRGNDAPAIAVLLGSALIPLGVAGYAISWFFTHVGAESGLVGRGFLFGVVAKLVLVFVLPVIKTILWGIPTAIFLRIIGLKRKTMLVPIEEDEKAKTKS